MQVFFFFLNKENHLVKPHGVRQLPTKSSIFRLTVQLKATFRDVQASKNSEIYNLQRMSFPGHAAVPVCVNGSAKACKSWSLTIVVLLSLFSDRNQAYN